LLARATWNDRQERLKVNLCNETTAFFPKKGDMVVVHQLSEDLKFIPALMDQCDYQYDGLVFQPVSGRATDPLYLWRAPENVTIDFRLGPMLKSGTVAAPGPADAPPVAPRLFQLEVFDVKAGKHVAYHSDAVEVPFLKGNNSIVEGLIVTCGLEQSSGRNAWIFHRSRNDISIAAFKAHVDEVLQDCLIPKSAVLNLSGLGPDARSAFGSALSETAPTQTYATIAGAEATQPLGVPSSVTPMSDAARLRELGGGFTVNVQPAVPSANAAVAQLQSLLKAPVSVVSVVTEDSFTTSKDDSLIGNTDVTDARDRQCGDCRQRLPADQGKFDPKSKTWYCFPCWKKIGFEVCSTCNQFAEGVRKTTRRRVGDFFCNSCFDKLKSDDPTRVEHTYRRGSSNLSALAASRKDAEGSPPSTEAVEGNSPEKPPESN